MADAPSGPPLILVLGGTGTAGRAVVADARARGLRVRVLARRLPPHGGRSADVEYVQGDIVTGVGLIGALTGASAVIDATNGSAGASLKTLTTGPRVVAAAARIAKVRRLVLLSIVGIEQTPLPYYRAKVAQEQAYRESGLQFTIVRATQFHDLVDRLFGLAPFGWTTRTPGLRFQPVAVADVARVLVDEAVIPPGRQRVITVAGPEVLPAHTIASLRRSAHLGNGPIIPLPLPRRLTAAFRNGANLPPHPDVTGTLSFAEWLTRDVGRAVYPESVTMLPLATWCDTLAVFDLETTGIDVETSRIVSATVAVIDAAGTVTERIDWIVDPAIDIPEQASAVHGLTTEYVRIYGRVAAEAITEIVNAVRGHLDAGIPLVAYNAAYDLTILNREARRYGIAPLATPAPIIDPFVIDKAVDRYRKGKRTLSAATEHYGVVLTAAHDAGADAIAAGHLAQAIARRYPHALAMTAEDLHARQVDWCREHAESFQEWMRREKDPEFTTSGAWPER
ncbi:NAD(P)H-binding protein [Rathayibacter sp. YIM 133350]|uniref:NAD(P)H-binding protein n=1 Tax=Rathayibacter sp. YIM 133350 TaxID=3131992 RepID=UPI00307FB8EC